MTLYNLRTALDDYRITKFTKDLDVESSYLIGAAPPHECECPAGVRPTCRHRQMLGDLLPLVDTEFFWDFERHTCVDADGTVAIPQAPKTELHLGEPLITIEGAMPNQFVVVENDRRGEGLAPAQPWRRI
jgi:hypothetical protein